MSVKIFHFTTINFKFLKDEQRHQVLVFCNSVKNIIWEKTTGLFRVFYRALHRMNLQDCEKIQRVLHEEGLYIEHVTSDKLVSF